MATMLGRRFPVFATAAAGEEEEEEGSMPPMTAATAEEEVDGMPPLPMPGEEVTSLMDRSLVPWPIIER